MYQFFLNIGNVVILVLVNKLNIYFISKIVQEHNFIISIIYCFYTNRLIFFK